MTAQDGERFLFNDQEFWIEGLTGGEFLRAEDFGISPNTDGVTSLWRGFQSTYGIDVNEMLVVKHLMVLGDNFPPINGVQPVQGDRKYRYHYYELNFPFPLTGHVLFYNNVPTSLLGMGHWAVVDEFRQKAELYELEAVGGKVVSVQNITKYVLDRIVGKAEHLMPLFELDTDLEEYLSDWWDWTTTYLPRRYDILYWAVNYIDLNTKKAAL